MKSIGVAKQVLLVFVVVLVGYIAIYSAIEHRRTCNGPWQLTFTNDASGAASLVVNQPKLAITNLWISFPDAMILSTNARALDWKQPIETPFPVPFGRCVFMDLTSLPGTLVFEMSGHEIQLLPRILTIDKKEGPWESGQVIRLPAQNPAP